MKSSIVIQFLSRVLVLWISPVQAIAPAVQCPGAITTSSDRLCSIPSLSNQNEFNTSDGSVALTPPMVKRAATTSESLPFPPSAWFNINNITGLVLLSEVMVGRMQTWYTPNVIPNYEWVQGWQVPVLGMALANLDLALGNNANKGLITDLLSANSANNFIYDRYLDDSGWWAMFALRGYQAYGNENLIGNVKAIIASNLASSDNTCGGGVRWLDYNYSDKNTITNSLHFSTLTRLYRFTGDQQYFDDAVDTLNWLLGWFFETTTGRVWDTISAPTCTRSGLQAWTYNSGVILSGLADLFHATGNVTLLNLGRTIAYAGMRDFTTHDVGILSESCEHDPPSAAGGQPGCSNDLIVFKGALMMGLAEFYMARPDSNIYNFINTQLLSVVFNDLDPTWLAGELWGGPWNVTTAGPKTQINGLCLVSAAAIVNANFLSSVSTGNRLSAVNDTRVTSSLKATLIPLSLTPTTVVIPSSAEQSIKFIHVLFISLFVFASWSLV